MPYLPDWKDRSHSLPNGYTQTVADAIRLLSSVSNQSLFVAESNVRGNLSLFSEADGYVGYVDLVCGRVDIPGMKNHGGEIG